MIWLRRVSLLLLALAALTPLVWTVANSFKGRPELLDNLWGPPREPTLANYRRVLREPRFLRHAANSALVTTLAVGGLAAGAAAAAYGFARFRFPGRRWLWALFLAGLFLPVHATLIPLNQLEGRLGLAGGPGSLLFLAAVYFAFNLSFSVWFLRTHFAQLPEDLFDAARLDGCGQFGVFRHVVLPLSLPALTVVCLVNFVMVWNEFVFALVLLPGADYYTLPLAVKNFADETGLDLGPTCAAMTLTVAPVLVLFAAGQKWLLTGLTAGALKG